MGAHPRVPWPCLNIYPSKDRGSFMVRSSPIETTLKKPNRVHADDCTPVRAALPVFVYRETLDRRTSCLSLCF